VVIEKHYGFLKSLNPSLRFLVRERTDPNFDAIIEADFGGGKMETESVSGKSEAEVLGKLSLVCTLPAAISCRRIMSKLAGVAMGNSRNVQ